ncbi:LOW QUALITY PROTEIN: hypothetical protein ACHAWX_004272 [Stephanocyclus meneghinianus]
MQPTSSILHAAMLAPTGNDELGEDPTVIALQEYVVYLFQKQSALYIPIGTKGDLCTNLVHCHYNRLAEMILGKHSHINFYEGGGYAIWWSAKQVSEDENAMLDLDEVHDAFHADIDDHYAKTALIYSIDLFREYARHIGWRGFALIIGSLAHRTWEKHGVKVHVNGARIFNHAISQSVPTSKLCSGADSVSICLSKGLGTPMGSVLVGGAEFIRLAKRARKRLGGGMRQSCIMAAMGMYALQHNVDCLAEDHANAQNLARALKNAGFWLLKDGKVDTNVVLFGLPENCKLEKEDLTQALYEGFGVKITGGYSSRGKLFRLVAHMNIDEKEVERATAGIISLCCG